MESIERIDFPGLILADGDTLTTHSDGEIGNVQSATVTRDGKSEPEPVEFIRSPSAMESEPVSEYWYAGLLWDGRLVVSSTMGEETWREVHRFDSALEATRWRNTKKAEIQRTQVLLPSVRRVAGEAATAEWRRRVNVVQ